jgi:superfamily II DNA or RNA helicase
LTSAELLVGEAFKTYFARRKREGKITRVIFDEIHHIVTAGDWRKKFPDIV